MLELNLGGVPEEQGSERPEVENTIIVGSGPAGWTAGLYTARANLNPLLITGNELGGQVSLTYEIENYPGFPEGLSGPELVERFKQQAERFGCTVEYDHVVEIGVDAYPFTVRTASGQEYRAKSLILCTGASPRKLNVPGEAELTGRGVSYCATCDGFFFKDKDVIVVGGGDSAVEEGLFLTKFARRVRIVHRRDQLRASKILQRRAFENPKIEFVWNTVVTAIHPGPDGSVARVTARDVVTGEERELTTDGVFIFIGHVPNNELFQGKLHLDPEGYLVVDRKMQTNIPGIFAAGEIMDKVYRQVATSVGQGAAAGMQAERFLAETEAEGYPGIHVDPREFPDPREEWAQEPVTS